MEMSLLGRFARLVNDIGFDLTSKKFMLLLALLAVVSFVLLVWVWPRLSQKGLKSVLGRVGLLGLATVTALAAVASVVNWDIRVYPKWSDLLGTGDGTQNIVGVADRDDQREGGLRVTSSSVPSAGDRASSGQIDTVEFSGPTSGLKSTGSVYLPPQYFSQEQAPRLPVVLVVAGTDQKPEDILKGLDPANAGGTPAIWAVVGLAGTGATACVDVPGGPQAQTFVGQDAPQQLTTTYRIAPARSGWAIAGVGDGGGCALMTGLAHSAKFNAVVSLGGEVTAPDNPRGSDLYGGSGAIRDTTDPLWRVQNLPAPPLQILLGQGKNQDAAGLDALEKAAREPTRVSRLSRTGGGDDAVSWKPRMREVAKWLGERLDDGTTTP
ncbi:alpha/beta hydrolase [Nocardiopsis rhodophaea]|uniref:alpha/beta hydrolase n=1 Tax=Nocardiopsis rhodophaea TaxID=280238 RepID=UPI0031E2B172